MELHCLGYLVWPDITPQYSWSCRFTLLPFQLWTHVSSITIIINMQPTLLKYSRGSRVLPDEHNNPNFGYIVPDNFPWLLDHLNLILAGIRSSSSSILRVPLSKLCFSCHTWYCAAHSSYKKKLTVMLDPRRRRKKTRVNWFCARWYVMLLASGLSVRLRLELHSAGRCHGECQVSKQINRMQALVMGSKYKLSLTSTCNGSTKQWWRFYVEGWPCLLPV